VRQSTVIIALLAFFCAVAAFGADKKIISPPGTKPGGNYSQGILVDGTLYISGQGGEDAAGKIPRDFDSEVKQCLDNIGEVLKAAGMSPDDVVSVQVYLGDAGKFQRMNLVYTNYFKDPRPTRTTVVVAGLVGPGTLRSPLLQGNSRGYVELKTKGEYKCLTIVVSR
jgi:2-iminobutanoate/2-iminopropanoate deaminase